MTEAALVELLAKAISPYGWRDDWWTGELRADQYPRNQQHVKNSARSKACDVIRVLRENGILKAE